MKLNTHHRYILNSIDYYNNFLYIIKRNYYTFIMKNIFKNAKLFNLYLNFSKLNSLVILIVARKNSSLSVINEKYFFMMFLYKEKTYNLIYFIKNIYIIYLFYD